MSGMFLRHSVDIADDRINCCGIRCALTPRHDDMQP